MDCPRPNKIVLTLVIFVFAVLVLAVVKLSFTSTATVNKGKNTICTTEDCLRSATMMVESMDRDVDPCDDFYGFACGNYGEIHKIPKSSISNDRFAELQVSLTNTIREFLEREDNDSESYSVSQARVLYRSCMATDEMEAAGLDPLFKMLDQVGLPHFGFNIKNSKKRDSNLSILYANIKKYLNIDFLFSVSVDTDTKNRTINRISLSKPKELNIFPAHKVAETLRKSSSRKVRETLASEENVEKENDSESEGMKFVKSFGKYFKNICMEIIKYKSNSARPNTSDLGNLAMEILTFQNEIQNLRIRVYDSDNELPTAMTIRELQSLTDNITKDTSKMHDRSIDWELYFTTLFEGIDNFSLTPETDIVIVNNVEYFESLLNFLLKYSKSTIILNMWWQIVDYTLPYTTSQMRFFQNRLLFETSKVEVHASRSSDCATAVNKMMGMAVSNLLLENMDPIDRNNRMIVEMFEDIRWAFEKTIQELKWMDDTTKRRTLFKAQQMQVFSGFPEILYDPDELDRQYRDFELKEKDYFGNVVRYVQRELRTTLEQITVTNNFSVSAWASEPLNVNAFNLLQANAITVPAGIMRFPFFGHDLQVLNYGLLGSILGHEFTHGFDDTGRKFDHEGNENMWWTNKTIEEYKNRSDCFVQHYESYVVPGINEKISGKLTLDENIADNGGLREALWGYRKYVTDHGEEPKLPGFEEYSNEQLYFLAFANTWCEASSTESLSNSLNDEHSPNYIRVTAGLINSEEFSEVWKCKKGSVMNPQKEKCKLW